MTPTIRGETLLNLKISELTNMAFSIIVNALLFIHIIETSLLLLFTDGTSNSVNIY